VPTVTVAVPLAVVELNVTVWLPFEQLGRSDAPVGDEVSAQVIVTLPAYSLVEAIVTVEVADAPGAIAAGEVAATVKPPVTVTFTTVVAVIVPDVPVTVTA
jgi:hypothetical protein